ncbi:ATP-binding protein [Candidatus Oscillochloris fontis]|uniref:ATP-binding protein n=1 Tax=Candidatus Oscillochloris fontis TaxID=2496868 RepID=UPI00101B656F|nr:SbcC/MukB-like Walker B domain-containing protein [Candidatus Oscillochloris fontis]
MKPNGVLALSRIFLHNWHRFNHHLIDVQDGLYLAGHNGSGKSSVLDALQFVLIADQQRIRYNSSAQERSARTLDSYVRGKIGENRYLRPGNTVAYIALEFTHAQTQITLGVCIEATDGQTPERTFFILLEPIDPGLFVVEGRPLLRRELRAVQRGRRGMRIYDQVGEYQADLLNRLGGLHERFFDLFLRALTFQPIRNINTFVEQWLLDGRPLDVDALQKVVERLDQLRVTAREVQEKIAALQAIENQQAEVRNRRDLHTEYLLLVAFLRLEDARSYAATLATQRSDLLQRIAAAERACTEAAAARQGAETAWQDAVKRLGQLDVVRRRDELQKRIAHLRRDADQIHHVYKVLREDLQREADALGDLALPSVVGLCAAIRGLTPEVPPAPDLPDLLDQAVVDLDALLPTTQERRYELTLRKRTWEERATTLEQELKRLRENRRLAYAPALERLRDLLTPIVGERPPLLCELLEIPNERWQNAVEAMLGARRFNIIVPPEYFERALDTLDSARANERIYDVGLLDLAKVQHEARPAQPGSLAQQVRAKAERIQKYVDSLLGDVITCAAPRDLRRHRRAITAEVLVYSEWTVRAIPPERYQPWFIGERAQRSQIDIRQRELDTVRADLLALTPQLAAAEAELKRLERGRNLSNLRQRLDAPLDERPLRSEIQESQAELQALDTSGVAALEAEIARLRTLADHEQQAEQAAIRAQEGLKSQLPQLEEKIQRNTTRLAEAEQKAEELRVAHPQRVVPAEERLAERLARGDLAEALRNAESTVTNFESRANNELQRLIEMASAFNTRFQFAALPSNVDEGRYTTELERLQATELPKYIERIDQAQHEAEEELREHVLHRLREQIIHARSKLDWINDALERLAFHGERYRFRSQPSEDARHFYDLINDSQLLGSGSLFASDFYQRHKTTFDEFYARLTRTPQSDAERREQERLVDYRRYLNYDIEITHPNGQVSRLSRIMGQTSGGETQTPFYLTIAASFVQLYHIGERQNRPTIRLVAFDEAFSKMDQDRIGATLDLFQQFGLQIITATPLERCEYLVPKICTSLVLSAVDDGVWVEPYRNYAARLSGEGGM